MGGQDNSMMQDSSSQQSSTNGLFGGFGSASQQSSAPAVNGFTFGQSSNAGGSTGSSVFGQPKPQEETKPAFSAGLFGSQPHSNGFTPAFGQTPSSSFPPASSPSPAPMPFGSAAPAPAPTFKFGETSVVENSSTTPEPVESTTPKAKSLFSFGQSANFTTSTPDAGPASAPPKPLFNFGQPSSSSQNLQSTTTPSKPLFGATVGSPNPPEPSTAPAKPLFNFGQLASKPAEQAQAANPFGTPSKSAEPAGASTSLFGRASPAADAQPAATNEASRDESTEPEGPSNPFSGFFGSSQAAPAKSGSTPASGFQFKSENNTLASPAKQSAPPPAAPAKSPAVSDKPPSLFSFPATVPTTNNPLSQAPAATPPANNLFNLNKPTPAPGSENGTTQSQTSTSVFSKTNEMNANAGSTPFKTFGQAQAEDAGPAKKKLFQSPTAAESMAQFSSGQSEKASGPTEPVQPKFTQPQKPQPAKESVIRAVSTEGPPQIPRFLNGDKYKSYDENWRLKALNRKFREVVSSTEPDTHDFLSIVQNYLDHRESIGEGLSHWMRKQIAGSKRKPDDVDDMQPENESSKRSKASDNAPAPKPTVSATNLFGSVPSPKPATNASPARGSDSTTSNMFKSLIPGATAAQPTSQTAAPLFSFTPTPAKSTTPPSSPPKSAAPQLPKFEPPKFGGGSVDFMGAFAKNAATSAEKAEQEAKAKRKAEEFDSDEDDEEAWERKYEEEQKQKKAKLNSIPKAGFTPGFVPSVSSTRSNSPFTFAAPTQSAPAPRSDSAQPISDSEKAVISIESDGEGRTGSTSGESGHAGNESGNSGDDEDEEEDDLHEEQAVEQEEEEEGEPIPDLPVGESLFDRITKSQPTTTKSDDTVFGSATKPYYKPGIMFNNIGKESPEQPTFSPFTPKGDFVPASSFNFTPATTSGPAFGASLLKEGPIPGEGLFGSRPSTPQPGGKESSSVFGSTQKPTAGLNNTWTKGSPIKFSESTASDKDAPTIEVSAATPPAAKESSKSTFGSSSFFGAASSTGGSVGFNFGSTSTQPAPGYLAAASHLGSGGASGLSSRGSSPGLVSEAESVNTDASTAQDEVFSNQPQISLMAANAGEENEDVLFDAKAQLSRNYRKADLPENTKFVEGWNKIGTGMVKLLKDKDTGKCRILFRAEPNANILLNTRLAKTGAYKSIASGKNGSLTFPVAVEGGIQMWMLRIKTKDQTDSLEKLIEENKAN